MKKPLIFFASVALAMLGTAGILTSGNSPAVSVGTPSVLLSMKDSGQPIESPNPAPGVYTAKPYSMLVVVPKPVDAQMVVGVADTSRFAIRSTKPETRLEPMTP